jgi:hypothetical protein
MAKLTPPAVPGPDRSPSDLNTRLSSWRAGLLASGQSVELADWIISELRRTWRIETALRMACETEAASRAHVAQHYWGATALEKQHNGAKFLLLASGQRHSLPYIDLEKPDANS